MTWIANFGVEDIKWFVQIIGWGVVFALLVAALIAQINGK